MPILTSARQAVWEAIDNWDELKDSIRRKYRFEDNSAVQKDLNPTIGDLPALAIYPSPTPLEWVTNQQHRVGYTLGFQLWTKHWNLLEGEDLWEKIVRGIYQSRPSANERPYVDANIRKVMQWGPVSARRAQLANSKNKVTIWDWTVNLNILAALNR